MVSPTSESYEGLDLLLTRKLSDFKYSLSITGNPSRIWSQYNSLLNYMGHEKLPLEIHQQVLRKCTPSSTKLRFSGTRRLLVGNRPSTPHMHEGRFQVVIRAIRALGTKPDLDDYHFILEQFGAVGHHVGVMHVYKELLYLGLEPKSKTFGLCLQAIAHRLTLPVLVINHPRLIIQTKKMTAELLSDMQKYRVPFTSVNLDLCTRILKETLDRDGFHSLMKWGYGIDLSNPDRVPLEYTEVEDRKVNVGISDIELPALPTPQPFSTAALNTTIDMLGRFGNISKLIQAFEVLTQPVPQVNQHLFSSFDDDDFGVTVPITPSFTPYAEPNTTTFTLLIRHLCRAGHTILARHYLLQLIEFDKRSKHTLRERLKSEPDGTVAPRIAITRAALLPAFGESNRDKNVGLMRWLNTKLPKIMKRKRAEVAFFRRLREEWTNAQAFRCRQEHMHSNDLTTIPAEFSHISGPESPSTKPTVFFSSRSLQGLQARNLSSRIRCNRAQVGTVFDVDLDQPTMSLSHESKPFDIDLHIKILESDLHGIEQLASRVDDVMGRTIQRVKERLGRRVWNEKDIYIQSEASRMRVSRSRWTEIVNFKPRRGYRPGDGDGVQRPSPRRFGPTSPSLRLYRQPVVKSRSYVSRAGPRVAAATVSVNDLPTESRARHEIHDDFPKWNYLPPFLRQR
ncbi:hypothetical protein APHAL10511_002137 [Amanita phalloides]|nr:hypothetical protein APHAL10511_002137 [Amanita phalloides]